MGALSVVPFFAETGTAYPPEVVYALVGRDEYQRYQKVHTTLKDLCGKWW